MNKTSIQLKKKILSIVTPSKFPGKPLQQPNLTLFMSIICC